MTENMKPPSNLGKSGARKPYREIMYENYESLHVAQMRGVDKLESFEMRFSAWDVYYGRFLPTDRTVPVLDLGCGNGGLLYFLSRMGFTHCEGVDASSEQVRRAHALGIDGVNLMSASDFLKSPPRAYRLIFAIDILEHCTKDECVELVQLVHAALEPGGQFIVQVPNGESPFGNALRYGDFTHEICFTRTSLSQVLLSCGFESAIFCATGPVAKGLASSVRALLWKAIEFVLKAISIVETGDSQGIYTRTLISVATKAH